MRKCEIQFHTGSILRKEMLEEMYGYPRIALESYYASFGDGILYGLSWKERERGKHFICPGALKFHGEIYFQQIPFCVEEFFQNRPGRKPEIDGKYRLFFLPGKEYEESGRNVEEMELTLVQSDGLEEAKRKGFYYSYVSMDGERGMRLVDDKNCLYGLYAGTMEEGYRLPLHGLEKMASTLEEKQNKHYLDYEILKHIYSGTSVPTKLVRLYIREYMEQEEIEAEADAGTPEKLMEKFREAALKLRGRQIMVVERERTERKEEAKKREKIAPQGLL